MRKRSAIIGVLALISVLGVGYVAVGSELQVKAKYGKDCKVTERCGTMMYVDCGAAVDGPAYYLNSSLEVIGTSGGLCMGGRCSGAPKEWMSCTKPDQAPENNPSPEAKEND